MESRNPDPEVLLKQYHRIMSVDLIKASLVILLVFFFGGWGWVASCAFYQNINGSQAKKVKEIKKNLPLELRKRAYRGFILKYSILLGILSYPVFDHWGSISGKPGLIALLAILSLIASSVYVIFYYSIIEGQVISEPPDKEWWEIQ